RSGRSRGMRQSSFNGPDEKALCNTASARSTWDRLAKASRQPWPRCSRLYLAASDSVANVVARSSLVRISRTAALNALRPHELEDPGQSTPGQTLGGSTNERNCS